VNKAFVTSFIFVLFFFGCSKEKSEGNYVAKVNDVYLYKKDFPFSPDSNEINRNEFIKNWVTTELLAQEGRKNGIQKSDEFLELSQNAEREILKSLWLKKYFADKAFTVTTPELEAYYAAKQDAFKLLQDAVVVNQAYFNKEEKAIQFRNVLLESDWNKTSKAFMNDSTLVSNASGELMYYYEFGSGNLLNIVSELQPNEVSLVIKLKNDLYTVVQLQQKLKPGDVPPFVSLRKEIERTYLEEKQKRLLEDHLKELYTQNDIDIKK